MKNPEKPNVPRGKEGSFYTTKYGGLLFIYDYKPSEKYISTVFFISGITGINHLKEKNLIDLLSNNHNRVVVVHPRVRGYSDCNRGDIADFSN